MVKPFFENRTCTADMLLWEQCRNHAKHDLNTLKKGVMTEDTKRGGMTSTIYLNGNTMFKKSDPYQKTFMNQHNSALLVIRYEVLR